MKIRTPAHPIYIRYTGGPEQGLVLAKVAQTEDKRKKNRRFLSRGATSGRAWPHYNDGMTMMKTKQEITRNWLQRYTNTPLDKFGRYILLTNFNNYVDLFCEQTGIPVPDYSANMRMATAGDFTIINFGMGSPNAALVTDLLSAVRPEACLFLGKCGGVGSSLQLGDFLLPVAAVRGEGTSNDYFPAEVPALPHFILQRVVSSALKEFQLPYWAGVVYTTNRRVWEHDDKFKDYLRQIRVMGVEMECATLFSCGSFNHMVMGALLLVSDNPMMPEGVKTTESDRKVTAEFAATHVKVGIEALRMVADGAAMQDCMKFEPYQPWEQDN